MTESGIVISGIVISGIVISGMAKSSLVDYPGLVACVLFLPGCNYNCFYCHNRSLIDGTHDVLSSQYVKEFLGKRVNMLDGVVITGGEPTIHPDLIPFINTIKDFGYKIKLDTNGSSPKVIEKLLKADLCDYYAVDYKSPVNRYKEICGKCADGKIVLETINLLKCCNADFEVRTTVIPQLSIDDLICMSKELPKVPRYVLNRYRKPEKYLPCDEERVNKKPYTQTEINDFVNTIRLYQPNVIT